MQQFLEEANKFMRSFWYLPLVLLVFMILVVVIYVFAKVHNYYKQMSITDFVRNHPDLFNEQEDQDEEIKQITTESGSAVEALPHVGERNTEDEEEIETFDDLEEEEEY